jgi:hypothetical protein
MSIHELSLDAATPGERRARDLAAALLRVLSRALGLLAERVAPAASTPVLEAVLEYHADAGAPEGALYVNGQLVGHVLGVQRL